MKEKNNNKIKVGEVERERSERQKHRFLRKVDAKSSKLICENPSETK